MNGFQFKSVAIGVFLALLALLAGEMHGMAFGAKEDAIKAYYKESAQAAVGPSGDAKVVEKNASGAWKYLKRAHMHYMGLGAVAMALCIFIGLSPVADKFKTVVSTAVGFGAFVYPLFWTLVSCKTAEVGKHAAKESMALMAQAGAMVGFLGLLGTIAIAVMWFRSADDS